MKYTYLTLSLKTLQANNLEIFYVAASFCPTLSDAVYEWVCRGAGQSLPF